MSAQTTDRTYRREAALSVRGEGGGGMVVEGVVGGGGVGNSIWGFWAS